MWTLGKDKITVSMRDETLRDGGQGEVPRSACRAVQHILDTHDLYDQISIGWAYTNPTDIETANYLRKYGHEIGFARDKFFIYSLIHRGGEQDPSQVDTASPFGAMLDDLQKGTAPYGTVNILTKAREADLADFGADTTSASFSQDMVNTMMLLKKADPHIKLEVALEHFYTAWLEESDNNSPNRRHIIDTLVAALQAGAVGITAPDTDGAHTPDQITRVLTEVTSALRSDERLKKTGITFDPAMFIAHMHDDLGYAAANTITAINFGARSCDSTCGIMGERRGNATLAGLARAFGHPETERMSTYQDGLQTVLGLRHGDKAIGGADAFNAVGGMHASRLLKEWMAGNQSWEEFSHSYTGSYASVPPQRFGQAIEVTLSPVAGASNVLCMLASLGASKDMIRAIRKDDPRIAKILDTIKSDEHMHGINYRGTGNANARMLVANAFAKELGLPVRRTSIALAPPQLNEDALQQDIFDLTGGGMSLHATIQDRIQATLGMAHGTDNPLVARHLTDFALAQIANECMRPEFEKHMNDDLLLGLRLHGARQYEVHSGPLTATDGDPHMPQAHEQFGVTLNFTTDTKEQPVMYQASGAGETIEYAVRSAAETMLNFKLVDNKLALKKQAYLQ